jgi:hypothetical protein
VNLLDDEELTTKICKFGGPLVLFICSPLMGWILWKVAQKDISSGLSLHPKDVVVNSSIVLISGLFGAWMCRRGYGWFGGKRP